MNRLSDLLYGGHEEQAQMDSIKVRGVEFDVRDVVGVEDGSSRDWAIWIQEVYEELFNGVELVLSPTRTESPDEVYKVFEGGVVDVCEGLRSSGLDLGSMLDVRDRIREFQSSDRDEFTLVVTVCGCDSKIGYFDESVNDGLVTVDLQDKSVEERPFESSLREYQMSVLKSFCGRSPSYYRPNNRFERVLKVSFRKNWGVDEVTVDVESRRMEYAFSERLLRGAGFTPRSLEPIRELD